MNQESRIMNHAKINAIIRNSSFIIQLRRGFTLIELLVVIAILGIVAVAILAAINVTGNLTKANLSNAKTFAASVENSLAINQVGKWSFEEGSGTIAKDTSGYGNNGTISNSSMWKDPNTCGLGFGGCTEFGSGKYITILDSNSLEVSGDLTISVWIYPTNIGNPARQSIVYKDYNHEYEMIMETSGYINFYHGDGTFQAVHVPNMYVTKNQWNHVVLARTLSDMTMGGWLKGWLNGKFEGSVSFSKTPTPGSNSVVIGLRAGSGYYFVGRIDEVAIYNQALTFSQIQQLYAQGWLRHLLAYK